MAVRDRPDDVLRAERRIAAEEDAGPRRRHRRLVDDRHAPLVERRCRCRARSTGTHSPGRSRPARRRTGSARPARRSARSCRRPLASRLRRDLLEHDAGQLAVVVRERLRHEVVVDRNAFVHRVFLLPRRRLHLVEAGAHDDLHVLAAEAPRRCGSSPSPCCRRPARRRACRSSSCGRTTRTTASRCRCGCWPRLPLRPGMSRSRPRGAPLPTNTASQPSASSARRLSMRAPPRNSTPQVEDVADFLVDHAVGQPELRNLRAHHAAGRGVAVEHDALVAERREIARDGQRRRAGADQRDALAVARLRRLRQARRGCLPCSRRRRASAGRSRPARAWPRPCDARAILPRRGRAGTRARTAGRRCARGCPGNTFDFQLTR